MCAREQSASSCGARQDEASRARQKQSRPVTGFGARSGSRCAQYGLIWRLERWQLRSALLIAKAGTLDGKGMAAFTESAQ